MAYNDFANYYDLLNRAADYDALFCVVKKELEKYDVKSGIVADLGCGTGEMTIKLAKSGYDMIAVDLSAEMLSIAREKAYENELDNILFLQQNLTKLDMYGTYKAAICTFDTLNHISTLEDLEVALKKIALFLEPNCPFIFDMNTPYKHKYVLGNNEFEIEIDDVACKWINNYDDDEKSTKIQLSAKNKITNEQLFSELFCEYSYTKQQIVNACEKAGLEINNIIDGENFGQLINESERFFITATKKDENVGDV